MQKKTNFSHWIYLSSTGMDSKGIYQHTVGSSTHTRTVHTQTDRHSTVQTSEYTCAEVNYVRIILTTSLVCAVALWSGCHAEVHSTEFIGAAVIVHCTLPLIPLHFIWQRAKSMEPTITYIHDIFILLMWLSSELLPPSSLCWLWGTPFFLRSNLSFYGSIKQQRIKNSAFNNSTLLTVYYFGTRPESGKISYDNN